MTWLKQALTGADNVYVTPQGALAVQVGVIAS
jgi:hypothetical protein